MKKVASLRILFGNNYLNIGSDFGIEIVNNSIQVQTEEIQQILFPNGVDESTLEVLTGGILDALEMNDSDTVTIVIKQLKDLSDRDKKQRIGDIDLFLDENIFIIYIDEVYQQEIFLFSNVEVNRLNNFSRIK